MSGPSRDQQRFPLLNGVSPQKGRRSSSRPTTSVSEWKLDMINTEGQKHGQYIDQAGTKLDKGKSINSSPHFLANNSRSVYSPSFSDSSQNKTKRTKKLSRIENDRMPVERTSTLKQTRRRHSNTDVFEASQILKPPISNLTLDFALSPKMNRRGSHTDGVGKRKSLGFSNGPVTSSLQQDSRRAIRSISLQTDNQRNLHRRVQPDHQIGDLDAELPNFNRQSCIRGGGGLEDENQ